MSSTKAERKVKFSTVSLRFYKVSRSDAENVYCSDEDYDRIKESNALHLRLMEQGMPATEEITYRGLEKRTRKGYIRTSSLRRLARDAVFGEIARQEAAGESDDALIAEAYSQISTVCLKRAQRAAMVDASEAKLVCKSRGSPRVTGKHSSRGGLLDKIGGTQRFLIPESHARNARQSASRPARI